jgi:hypothetical protein
MEKIDVTLTCLIMQDYLSYVRPSRGLPGDNSLSLLRQRK